MQTTDLTIQVRHCDDDWIRALVVFKTTPETISLLQVPAPPFHASEEVRTKFNELAVALFKVAIDQALPGVSITDVKVGPVGAGMH